MVGFGVFKDAMASLMLYLCPLSQMHNSRKLGIKERQRRYLETLEINDREKMFIASSLSCFGRNALFHLVAINMMIKSQSCVPKRCVHLCISLKVFCSNYLRGCVLE